MTLRLALILTVIVVLLTCSVFGVTVYMFSQPGVVNREQRVSTIGGGTGMAACIALAGIWIPYAIAWKKRREEATKTSKPKKKKKRPRDEDDE